MKYTRTVVVLLAIATLVFVSGCGGKKVDTTPQAPVAKAPDDLEVKVEGSVTPTGSIGSLTLGTGDAVGPGDEVRFDAVASGLAQGDRLQVDVLESGWTVPLQQVAGERYTGTGTVPAGLLPGSYSVQGRILNPQGQEIDTRLADSKLVVMGQCSAMQRQLDKMTIHFDLDRSDLTPSSRALLQQVATLLKGSGRSDVRLIVEGHCDERGTTEYNLALGQRRARSTMDYLVDLGALDGSKFQPKSFGEERPVDRRSNEEAWAKNRRAEFKLTCGGN